MAANKLVKKLEAEIVRTAILKEGQRIDGRDTKTVRPIEAMVGFLPRTHGSALFTRGETQAICTTTLGTKEAEQMIDGLTASPTSASCSTITSRPIRSAKSAASARRAAAKSVMASWPGARCTRCCRPTRSSPIRSASSPTSPSPTARRRWRRCAAARWRMMDAGVPLKRPVSGIAMGLILEGKDFAVISDILGDEDHLGDMDFKVAGTSEGITSLQMDIKIAGITEEIMKTALAQAKDGRAHILGEMAKALDHTREELSAHAPRIETMQIPKDKIRDVIGTGGKVIREIVAETGAKVDIDDEGVIKISSSDLSQIEAARQLDPAASSRSPRSARSTTARSSTSSISARS